MLGFRHMQVLQSLVSRSLNSLNNLEPHDLDRTCQKACVRSGRCWHQGLEFFASTTSLKPADRATMGHYGPLALL